MRNNHQQWLLHIPAAQHPHPSPTRPSDPSQDSHKFDFRPWIELRAGGGGTIGSGTVAQTALLEHGAGYCAQGSVLYLIYSVQCAVWSL